MIRKTCKALRTAVAGTLALAALAAGGLIHPSMAADDRSGPRLSQGSVADIGTDRCCPHLDLGPVALSPRPHLRRDAVVLAQPLHLRRSDMGGGSTRPRYVVAACGTDRPQVSRSL